jgi:hypothetical protein
VAGALDADGQPGGGGEADGLDDVLRRARLDDGGGRGADGDVPRGGQPGVQVLAGQGERAGEAAAAAPRGSG